MSNMQSLLSPLLPSRPRHPSRRSRNTNTDFLNALLGVASLICLWSFWNAIPSSVPSRAAAQVLSTPQQLVAVSSTDLWNTNQAQLVPLVQDHHGKHVLLLMPLSPPHNDHPKDEILPHAGQTVESTGSSISATSTENATTNRRSKPFLKASQRTTRQHASVSLRKMAVAPINLTSKGVSPLDNLSTSPKVLATPQSSSFISRAACFVLVGIVLTKKGVDRVRKWEQRSQEDSLAYDMAYTDSRSELSYGSFVSTAWSDDLDKFDV